MDKKGQYSKGNKSSSCFFIFTKKYNKIKQEVDMKEIIKELKLIINKELYQKKIISFEEFKLMNEEIIRGTTNECSSN